ncbi:MAG: hypothetical protein JWO99_571 [Candidatus Saccharibacteria bacterium]|nr:hypothetical protein [Candidatus Saccharibacteria bacterium]
MSERAEHGFTSALPPRELWLYNPDIEGLMETSLDGRGLVDLDQLVTDIKATIDKSFDWTSQFNDVHHLQWFAHKYPPLELIKLPAKVDDILPVDMIAFRELANRKAYVPRVFHNWVHRVTRDPPVPSEEVMRYSIDAQRVAMSLSRTASLAVRLTRMSKIPEKRLAMRLDQEFENYNIYLDNARLVPKEYSLLAIESLEIASPDDIPIVNRRLARLALDKIPLRNKAVLGQAA